MSPDGPFLAISPGTFPGGFDHAPPGGLCLSVFLFVRDAQGRLLLGRYAEDARWTSLGGLDMGRVRKYAEGWTLPSSHLKIGEDPRDAARRVAAEMLGLPDLRFGEPRVATEVYELARLPGQRHHDVLFLVDAEGAPTDVRAPPWYAELAWRDPATTTFGRGHEDVVARWRALS